MTAKEAKVELVTYNIDDIKEVTVALIFTFAKHSEIYGTEQWIDGIFQNLKTIDKQQPTGFSLNADGVAVAFSGFPKPRPLIKDGGLIYEAREPRFTIEDHGQDVRPRGRTKIAKAASDIAQEFKSVYHLRSEYPPHILIFSKQEFAKERVVFRAAIL